MNLYLMIIFVEILVNAHADARPGEKLNKGMLPILIQRVDERDVAITNENAHPQNQSIVRTVYTSQKLESKWQAMKKLLDILGLQVRFYRVKFPF